MHSSDTLMKKSSINNKKKYLRPMQSRSKMQYIFPGSSVWLEDMYIVDISKHAFFSQCVSTQVDKAIIHI